MCNMSFPLIYEILLKVHVDVVHAFSASILISYNILFFIKHGNSKLDLVIVCYLNRQLYI